MINQVMTNWSRYVKEKEETEEDDEEKRERGRGGGEEGSYFSHRQW
jgi:hypothetical protein